MFSRKWCRFKASHTLCLPVLLEVVHHDSSSMPRRPRPCSYWSASERLGSNPAVIQEHIRVPRTRTLHAVASPTLHAVCLDFGGTNVVLVEVHWPAVHVGRIGFRHCTSCSTLGAARSHCAQHRGRGASPTQSQAARDPSSWPR